MSNYLTLDEQAIEGLIEVREVKTKPYFDFVFISNELENFNHVFLKRKVKDTLLTNVDEVSAQQVQKMMKMVDDCDPFLLILRINEAGLEHRKLYREIYDKLEIKAAKEELLNEKLKDYLLSFVRNLKWKTKK